MQIRKLHSWHVDPAEARDIQRRLATQVSRQPAPGAVDLIAGVDVSTNDRLGIARAAVVVLRYPDLAVQENSTVEEDLTFLYIPGLLSFREAPAVFRAFERISSAPDLVMIDGQGIAHPRRLGIASHVGLILDIPTIGVAKSILVGRHRELPDEPGAWVQMFDRDEVVGAAVRTKRGVKPVYVSIGHKVDLPVAISWTLNCCRSYRLPEPTRLAHLAAASRLPIIGRY
ncbi:MAG: deoxyribonuclease V [Chloroflexi bacterium]|nr:deoxyribonuclease V [Chloroflexota bacterium]